MTRPICFASDYGHADDFAGVCRGVIARVAPEVRVIDVTHGLPERDVLAGALVLRNTLPYMPERAVHLAVVDPGVGGPRRAVALRSGGDRLFVGPDNGLLTRAADVVLKERRTLVLLVRESPLHLGHLRTMAALAEMGAVILPPVPAFYAAPKTLEDLVDQTVARALDSFGYDWPRAKRWGEGPARGTRSKKA